MHHGPITNVDESSCMAGWQIAAAFVCGTPGVVLGLLLVMRRQLVVGCLLVAVGILPLALLSANTAGPGSGWVRPAWA
jgi:hypothetical protein